MTQKGGTQGSEALANLATTKFWSESPTTWTLSVGQPTFVAPMPVHLGLVATACQDMLGASESQPKAQSLGIAR